MSFWKLNITLEQPFCCAAKPLEGNETLSTRLIPATTLRGAVAASLMLSKRRELLDKWLGQDGPRWYPAWPNARDNSLPIPTPLCWAMDKSGGRKGIRNLFDEKTNADPVQWRKLDAPFCLVGDSGRPVGEHNISPEVQMRNALDYQRQASRETALYSRQDIPAKNEMTAWVDDPSEVLDPVLVKDLLEGEIIIGKRTSSGNGRCTLRIDGPPDFQEAPPWRAASPPVKDAIRLQLMSDAILPGPNGGFLRGFMPAAFAEAMGLDERRIELAQKFAESGPVFGWSRAWDMPREQAVALRAGSCCEFRFTPDVPSDAREAALERLGNGLGIRRIEGFGIVAVAPNWLYRDRPYDIDPAPKSVTTAALSLPIGRSMLDAEMLAWRKAVAEAERISKACYGRPAAQKIAALHAYSVRVPDVATVKAYLNRLAEGEADHGWKGAKDQFGPLFSSAGDDVHKLRFLLYAAAGLSAPSGEVKQDA